MKVEEQVDARHVFKRAFDTTSIELFMCLIFPPTWRGIAARIIESGAVFHLHEGPKPWAPRWTPIPRTVRTGKTELETHVKSCIFRAHDLIHQLWGLPIPRSFDEEEFYFYKRAQMCGEVAVLTIVEFGLCASLAEQFPTLRELLNSRNALPLLWERGPLYGKCLREIAARLDNLLHKKSRPKWVRDSIVATTFCDDYVPMLESDRIDIDFNWAHMKINDFPPLIAPDARYGRNLDGLELTLWMIDDFYHLMHTDSSYDLELTTFNWSRRKKIQLPCNWHAIPQR